MQLRREELLISNETRIKYLKVMDKLYKVAEISFRDKTIRAAETDIPPSEVPEQEIFDIFDFEEFKITLINNYGLGEVIDFEKFRQKRNMKS